MKVCDRITKAYTEGYLYSKSKNVLQDAAFLCFCVLVQLLMSCQAKLVKYRDEAVEAEELVNHLTQQVR